MDLIFPQEDPPNRDFKVTIMVPTTQVIACHSWKAIERLAREITKESEGILLEIEEMQPPESIPIMEQ